MDDIYKIGDVIRIISTNEDVNNHIFLIREISRSRNNTEIVLMDQYDSNFKYFLNVCLLFQHSLKFFASLSKNSNISAKTNLSAHLF